MMPTGFVKMVADNGDIRWFSSTDKAAAQAWILKMNTPVKQTKKPAIPETE